MIPQYRILQTSPTQWELDRANPFGGWRLVGVFGSEADALSKLSECIAADAFQPPEPQYFDARGSAVASPVQP